MQKYSQLVVNYPSKLMRSLFFLISVTKLFISIFIIHVHIFLVKYALELEKLKIGVGGGWLECQNLYFFGKFRQFLRFFEKKSQAPLVKFLLPYKKIMETPLVVDDDKKRLINSTKILGCPKYKFCVVGNVFMSGGY